MVDLPCQPVPGSWITRGAMGQQNDEDGLAVVVMGPEHSARGHRENTDIEPELVDPRWVARFQGQGLDGPRVTRHRPPSHHIPAVTSERQAFALGDFSPFLGCGALTVS